MRWGLAGPTVYPSLLFSESSVSTNSVPSTVLNARVAKVSTCVSVLPFQREQQDSEPPLPHLHSLGWGGGRLWCNWIHILGVSCTLGKEAAHRLSYLVTANISATEINTSCNVTALATSLLVEKNITQALSEQVARATFKRDVCFQEVCKPRAVSAFKYQGYKPRGEPPLRLPEEKLKKTQAAWCTHLFPSLILGSSLSFLRKVPATLSALTALHPRA